MAILFCIMFLSYMAISLSNFWTILPYFGFRFFAFFFLISVYGGNVFFARVFWLLFILSFHTSTKFKTPLNNGWFVTCAQKNSLRFKSTKSKKEFDLGEEKDTQNSYNIRGREMRFFLWSWNLGLYDYNIILWWKYVYIDM